MTLMEENLFVYGTLRRGYKHKLALWLEGAAEFLGSGRAQGRLYRIAGYPGFVPSEAKDDWVMGDVYHLKRAAMSYRVLDEYEGCGSNDPEPHEFRRVVTRVLLEPDLPIMASIYAYQGGVRDNERILSGDFLRA